MKKIYIMLAATMMFAANASAQKSVNVDFTGSLLPTIGSNIYVTTNQKICIGATFNVFLAGAKWGRNYTGILAPYDFENDNTQVQNVAADYTVGVVIGYQVAKNTKICFTPGIGGQATYYTAYDAMRILDPSGYYYTKAKGGQTSLMYGGFIDQQIYSGFGLTAGYNNLNKFTFGLSFQIGSHKERIPRKIKQPAAPQISLRDAIINAIEEDDRQSK